MFRVITYLAASARRAQGLRTTFLEKEYKTNVAAAEDSTVGQV